MQTADYARHVFTANTAFRQIPTAGIEDSVRARLRRKQPCASRAARSGY
ncbi:hypothetical protein [Streptomyces sp. NPDC005548]